MTQSVAREGGGSRASRGLQAFAWNGNGCVCEVTHRPGLSPLLPGNASDNRSGKRPGEGCHRVWSPPDSSVQSRTPERTGKHVEAEAQHRRGETEAGVTLMNPAGSSSLYLPLPAQLLSAPVTAYTSSTGLAYRIDYKTNQPTKAE